MGRVITTASSKGGVGKTTLTYALAEFLSRRGASVHCIDVDPNKNLSGWLATTRLVSYTTADPSDLVEVAHRMGTKHDYVLIDVPGANSVATVNAIDLSSLVLIPCLHDFKDVVEARRTYDHVLAAITKARRFSPKAHIPAAALLTKVDRRASVSDTARETLEKLQVPTMTSDFGQKAALHHASFSSAPVPYAAISEDIEAIGNEALALLETFHG